MTNAIWLSPNSSPGIFIFGHNPWRNVDVPIFIARQERKKKNKKNTRKKK